VATEATRRGKYSGRHLRPQFSSQDPYRRVWDPCRTRHDRPHDLFESRQAVLAHAITADQELQAPRSQELQAPRTAQAPRSANFTKATTLVKEAEAACKAGNTTQANQKAKAAMDLLK
jgi:hypothetical protein